MNYIKKFNELTKNDANIAGGKWASLGEMLQHNIPVPDGYVVTAETFDYFIKNTGLQKKITSLLETFDKNNSDNLKTISEGIQNLIIKQTIPEDVANEILEAFLELNIEYVAVRSSATAEDWTEHAWAWQLSSYLNTKKSNLLDKVKACWASLFTPRAISYRFEKNLDKTHISVAVVIQKMINSEKSGIAFSVHPVSEDYNQVIIEAGVGLWEAIVSGSVTPDSYIVTKTPHQIIELNINTQTKALYRSSINSPDWYNEWKDLIREEWGKQVLTKEQILDLSNIIQNIEKHYGFPCDIEWAYEDGKFYIVQSRPITTLKKSKAQGIELLSKKFVDSLGGQDLYPPLHHQSFFAFASGNHSNKYFTEDMYDTVWSYPTYLIHTDDDTKVYFGAGTFTHFSAEVFEKYQNNTKVLDYYVNSFYNGFDEINKLYEELTYDVLWIKNNNQLFNLIEIVHNRIWTSNFWSFFSMFFDKEIAKGVFSAKKDYSEKVFEDVWNISTEPIYPSFDNKRNYDVVSYVLHHKNSNIDKVAERFQYIFTSYNGLLGLENVKKNLKSEPYVSLFGVDNPGKRLREYDDKYRVKKKKFEDAISSYSQSYQDLANYCQTIIHIRDERKNYFNKGLTLTWRMTELLFERFNIDKKYIKFISPIYDFSRGVERLKDIQPELIRRSESCACLVEANGNVLFNYEHVDKELEYMNKIYDKDLADNNKLAWTIGAPWIIKGRVKVVLDPHITDFSEGDILVAGMTRPEYVSLMKKAAAIVTDEGGITCHAAIISRELDIPCIIGTKNATRVLKDGDIVEVDANNGVVNFL